jgi:hypothetical protein
LAVAHNYSNSSDDDDFPPLSEFLPKRRGDSATAKQAASGVSDGRKITRRQSFAIGVMAAPLAAERGDAGVLEVLRMLGCWSRISVPNEEDPYQRQRNERSYIFLAWI